MTVATDDRLTSLRRVVGVHAEAVELHEPFVEVVRRFAHRPGTVALLSGGKIVQYDTPQAIYDLPADRFVADFIGSGALIPCRIEAITQDFYTVRLPDDQRIALRLNYTGRVDERIVIAVRPEAITLLGSTAPDSTRALMGRVENPSYLGARYECDFRFGETTLRIETGLAVAGVRSDLVCAELADIRYAAFPST